MNNEIVITNHNPQDITITQDENQLIFINGGGEVIGITDVKVNGSSVVSNNIAYVIVPTKTSELQNNSGFITNETDPTVPTAVKNISVADINNWNNKQNALVSGSTIKTINNESILGSGNIEISGTQYSAGTGIDITNDIITNIITSYNDLVDLPTIPTKTSDLLNDSDFVSEDELSEVAFTGSYASLSNTPTIPDSTSELNNDSGFVTGSEVSTEIQTAISTKQDTLVSGTNIKTVNNNSLLGSGNINISGGGSTDVQINGTSIVNNDVANIITESAYNSSTNKIATKSDIPSSTSQLTNDSNFAVTNANNHFSVNQTFDQNLRTMKALRGFDFIGNPTQSTTYTVTLTESMFNYTGGGAVLIMVTGWNQSTTSQASLYLLSWSGHSLMFSALNTIIQGDGSCNLTRNSDTGTLTLTMVGSAYNLISLL